MGTTWSPTRTDRYDAGRAEAHVLLRRYMCKVKKKVEQFMCFLNRVAPSSRPHLHVAPPTLLLQLRAGLYLPD